MASFEGALRAVNKLKADGAVDDYAVAGSMALVFWTEPVATFDLDVLVLLPGSAAPLVSLDAIHHGAASEGYPAQQEHIVIQGLPVQFVPAPNALAREAIVDAADVDYNGIPVRVVRPEYLIALYLQPEAKSHKRRERAAALMELPGLNRALVDEILARHGLSF